MPFALLGRVATPIARECGVATPIVHSLTMKGAISRCSIPSFYIFSLQQRWPLPLLESAGWPFALLERVATPSARECGVATPIAHSL